MRRGIIVQARMGSTRLPKKMILPFFEEKGILETLLLRLLNAVDIEKTTIILATTVNPLDDEIEDIGNKLGVFVFRGNELDVLDRFIRAAKQYNLSSIIRVCADNPLLDMGKLNELVEIPEKSKFDYYSFATSDLKPTILTSYGFWPEYVTLKALEDINSSTNDKHFREHVTNYIYTNPDKYNIKYSIIDSYIESQRSIRLTIDTEIDFTIVKEVFSDLKNNNIDLTAKAIVNFVSSRSNWTELMQTQILANKK